MNLPEDLQRILNIGAKVYNTQAKKQGKVVDTKPNLEIAVDYGNSVRSELMIYDIDVFKKMLLNDEIVSNSRLTMGSGDSFKVHPRVHTPKPPNSPAKVAPQPHKPSTPSNLKIGYVNFKAGRFSEEQKRGYTKIEYKKSTQKVEIEVNEDQLRKLREMGLI